MALRLVRFRAGADIRLGMVENGRVAVLEQVDVLAALRAPRRSGDELEVADPETGAPAHAELLAPVDPPEVWASGVTYERSRQARVEETQVQDVYSLVYEADRPEVFLKDAGGRRTVGPGGTIGVRSDGRWTVPEPELVLVLGEHGEPVAVTAGNDVTARDIEGANPLYLPQAKIFAGACAVGPTLVVPDDWSTPFRIDCRILTAAGSVAWEGSTSTARMRRGFGELARWATRENPIPAGSLLFTGTGLVPPDEVALEPGQTVEVRIPEVGTLRNPVGAAADLMRRS